MLLKNLNKAYIIIYSSRRSKVVRICLAYYIIMSIRPKNHYFNNHGIRKTLT